MKLRHFFNIPFTSPSKSASESTVVLQYILTQQCFIYHLAIQLGETRKVTILTHETGRADAPCGVVSTSPKGKTEDVPTEKSPEGYTSDFTPKEKGEYKVKVTYAGKEVPNSSFTVKVEALDISGVKVKGLEKRK